MLLSLLINQNNAKWGESNFLGKKWNTINSDWIQPAGMWWGCLPPTRHEGPHNNWGKKIKILYFDNFGQCLYVFYSSSVLMEDLSKSVCLVKIILKSIPMFCLHLTYFSQLQMVFSDVQGFCFVLLGKQMEGNNFNLWAPWSYFCYCHLGRPLCSQQWMQNTET